MKICKRESNKPKLFTFDGNPVCCFEFDSNLSLGKNLPTA